MRINQYLSHQGICSRRHADRLIRQGKVVVNGAVAAFGMDVSASDAILIENKPISIVPPPALYLLYHKPVGVVCTNADSVDNNLPKALADSGFELASHWFAVGRLDKESEGLLLITNQGAVAQALLHYKNKQAKQYIVTLDKAVSHQHLAQLSAGVQLGRERTLPCRVFRLAPQVIQFELVQGLNRQIRKMCQSLGFRVVRLQRVSFAGLSMQGLAAGEWRRLDAQEIAHIQRFVEESGYES